MGEERGGHRGGRLGGRMGGGGPGLGLQMLAWKAGRHAGQQQQHMRTRPHRGGDPAAAHLAGRAACH